MKKSVVKGIGICVCVLMLILVYPLGGTTIATATDHAPTPSVTIDYHIRGDLDTMKSNGALISGTAGTYYVEADGTSYQRGKTSMGTVKPNGGSYWVVEVSTSGTGGVPTITPTLHLAGNQLVKLGSGVHFGYTEASTKATVDGYVIDLNQAATPNTEEYGNLGILSSDGKYYTRTQTTWCLAVAQVQPSAGAAGNYYPDIAEAIEAANALTGSPKVVLLGDAVISTAATVDKKVSILYCNSSELTVGSNGILSLNGKVMDGGDTTTAAIILSSGGAITDTNGNKIEASAGSAVTGSATDLRFNGGSETTLVEIQGSFSVLNGYFNLTGNTTIATTREKSPSNPSSQNSVYVVGNVDNCMLTIEDGNVYTQTGFDNGKKIEISGGKLTVEQERTDISDIRGIGSGSGWIVINSGTTNLYGTVEKLDISGGKTLAIGSKVFLYGVAKDVSQAGAGTLTVGNDGNEVGQVTGQVRSIEKSEPYPVLYVGTEPIGNSVRTVVADGHFAKMSGHIKTQDTLTIDDANGVQEITGTNKHDLIINDVLSGSSPNLRGSFQNVTLKNSSFVFKDVKIEGTLTLDNSSVAAEGKNPFGKTANERAKVALTKSVLCISNASAFAYVKGIEDAHLHIDELANNTNNSSCIGIEGTFASVTGHVHTCGDVTMESTHDRATYDGGAPIEGTFLRDKAVVVGGTPLAKDLTSGKEWSLTLKDTKGHSNVELDSRKDYDANPAESNFRSIEVVDGVGASDVNNVSLTMAKGARAINLINENPPAPALGLKAVGDEKTVVGLTVNQITGSGIGVDLNNITAAITGAGLTNKIYSSNLEGILLDGANLHLHGFDLEGKTNGITMKNHGAINLHEVKNITGKTKGISVENGTVIGTVSGSGIITATADDGIAFYVKASTASLRDYNFMATGLRSTGVWVDGGATTDPVTQVTLSAITPASKIHGQENGIYVAENANLNIKDYEVKGTDSKNGQVKGGQVKGSLNLSGVNRFEGADYGLQVTGGIVTNKIGAKGAYDGSGLLKCGTDGQNALYVKDETVDLNRYNITGGSAANPPLVIESGEVTLSDSTITGTQQSKVAEKGILNIGSGVTLKDSDTLIVDGLLNVSQPMTTKVMVNKTGTLHIKDGGSIIGDITNVGKIQVDTGGSIIGTIANNGEVVVAGTVKGTVDGQGAVATLRVDNTTGTGIDVKGTFKTLTTTTKNAVTMVGELTIEGTGSKDSFATVNPNRVTPYNLTVKDGMVNAKEGTYGVVAVEGGNVVTTGTVNVAANSTVAENATLEITKDGTFNVGMGAGTLKVDGTFNVSGVVKADLEVGAKGIVNVESGGSMVGDITNNGTIDVKKEATITGKIINNGTIRIAGKTTGNMENTKTVKVASTGSVVGNIENRGDVEVTGTVSGTVEGTADTAILTVNNTTAAGIRVNVKGTFGTLQTTEKNKAIMVGILTIKGTGTGDANVIASTDQLTIDDGTVHVDATEKGVVGKVTVNGTKASVDVKGDFASMNTNTNAVKLAGNTVVSSGAVNFKGNIAGTKSKLTLNGDTFNIVENTEVTTGSWVNAGATLEVKSGKTFTVEDGDKNGNLTVHGTLTTIGTVKANLIVGATGTVNVESGGSVLGKIKNDGVVNVKSSGSITGDIENSKTITIEGTVTGTIKNTGKVIVKSTGSVVGDIENRGDVEVTGTVSGTVTGIGTVATLIVNNSSKTDVKVKGTFATLTTTGTNTGTMVGALIINGTEKGTSKDKEATIIANSHELIVNVGTVHVDATGEKVASVLTVSNGAIAVDVKGNFKKIDTNKNLVTLAGDTSIGGGTATVAAGISPYNLTISGGKIIANSGKYQDLVVTNGAIAVEVKGGDYNKATLSGTGKVNVTGDTNMKENSLADEGTTLTIKEGATLTVGSEKGTLTVNGTLNVTGTVKANLIVGTRGIVNVNDKGSVIGNMNNSNQVNIKSGGSVTGDIENSGYVVVTGTVSGTVTGKGDEATLTVNNKDAQGTEVKVKGTFATLTTETTNRVQMVEALTVNDGNAMILASDHQLTVNGGTAHVDATAASATKLTVSNGTALVDIKGNFATVNTNTNGVKLAGDTNIADGAGNINGNSGTNTSCLKLKAGTFHISEDTKVYTGSTVEKEATLSVDKGKKMTVIEDSGNKTKSLHMNGTLNIGSGGSVEGNIVNKGTIMVTGTITGTVDGQDVAAKLTVDNTSGTAVKAKGTFGTLTAIDPNKITMDGPLTMKDGDANIVANNDALIVEKGTAHVDAWGKNVASQLEVKGGTVDVKGNFVPMNTGNNAVKLAGDTVVSGGAVNINGNIEGTHSKLTVKVGTFKIVDNTVVSTGSAVHGGATLSVESGKTFTVEDVKAGTKTGDLTVYGTLSVTGILEANLKIGTTGRVNAESGGSVVGNSLNEGALNVKATASVTGDIDNKGDVTVTGRVSGVIDGQGQQATLKIDNGVAQGISVKVKGTFGTLTTTGDNKVHMVGPLTINETAIGNSGSKTGEANIIANSEALIIYGGTAHVDATAEGVTSKLTVSDGAIAVDVKGNFAPMNTNNNGVKLAGDTTISGGTVQFLGNTSDGTNPLLLLKGGNFKVAENTAINTGSCVNANAILTVNSGKTLNMGTGTLKILGTLDIQDKGSVKGNIDNSKTVTVTGSVTGNIKNSVDGTVTVTASGSAIGTVDNGGTLYIQKDGTVKGDISNSKTVAINGVVNGNLANSGTATVKSEGSVTGNIENTNDLIVTGLVTGNIKNSVDGTVTVTASGSAIGTVDNGGILYIQKDATVKGDISNSKTVTIYGAVNGNLTNSGTVKVAGTVTGIVDGLAGSKLTVENSSGTTVKVKGTVGILTTTGTNTIITLEGLAVSDKPIEVGENLTADEMKVDKLTLSTGKLTVSKLHAKEIAVGDITKAAIITDNVSNLSGSLEVMNGKILELPKAVGQGTFTGWTWNNGSNAVAPCRIIKDGKLYAQFYVQPTSGGGGGGAVAAEPSVTTLVEKAKIEDGTDTTGREHGTVSVREGKNGKNKEMIIDVSKETSFEIGTVVAYDQDNHMIPLTAMGNGQYKFLMPATDVLVKVKFVPLFGEPQRTPEPNQKQKSDQGFWVDGKRIDVQAYNINQNNYVKLRDIANIINGTGSQFSVEFTKGTPYRILLETGKAYVPVGGENGKIADEASTAQASSWLLDVNGVSRYLKCYNVGGNNYFQVRELGTLLGFDVDYKELEREVKITTKEKKSK